MNVIDVGETIVNTVLAPLICTDVTPANAIPVSVTTVPIGPVVGLID